MYLLTITCCSPNATNHTDCWATFHNRLFHIFSVSFPFYLVVNIFSFFVAFCRETHTYSFAFPPISFFVYCYFLYSRSFTFSLCFLFSRSLTFWMYWSVSLPNFSFSVFLILSLFIFSLTLFVRMCVADISFYLSLFFPSIYFLFIWVITAWHCFLIFLYYSFPNTLSFLFATKYAGCCPTHFSLFTIFKKKCLFLICYIFTHSFY